MIVDAATAADLDDLVALEDSFDRPWSHASWRAEVEGEGRLILIARRDTGEAIGAACFQLIEDVVDLHRIVVAPMHRRLGIARVMLVTGLQWAIGKGALRIVLEVDAGNEPAITLYRGYGFVPVATRRDYYGPGGDALVMQRSLEGVDADSVGMWDMEAT